jgi:hypothetical protein
MLYKSKRVAQVVDVIAYFVVSSFAAAMRQSGEPILVGIGTVVFFSLFADLHFRWKVARG